ncbi:MULTISPECIES: right-handed parallel beta-helix repeat-containing protein [Streptomyces]|uniref:Right-handed parallel beta-helix repeat-containing protein n=1 Tax=Streptomyces glycanivorans TaxID=3033808 RepID=A0ABY9JR04_9ACTN|nr:MULTISPECIES: right-handed parallel beta-helix repeat-containing protein [unclassified Streptomyces]WLQ68476.1 right-handed parallel beta-helix repeat-containing protein [Streptomyces sp. Alt3]WSR04833.1 right-handed parallel beta-helix repeat-containing protein [Streptomyces sp. NBC_01208]WSR52556.1 right-handed parallel beta-helix repeat-containing protein [Streptomyces sp. NBC_01201]
MRKRHMKCLAGITLSTATALGLAAVPSSAAGPGDLVVRPGDSIQSAVDAARPGDTIVVLPGTYRESVLITKPGLTLLGTRGRTVVAPPAADGAKAANACATGGNGICVIGTKGHTVDDVSIRSLTVSGFDKSGIWASWTDGLSVRKVTARSNGTWGIAQERSTRGDFRRNTATGNGDAGIFIANSVSEEGGATDTGGTLVLDNSVSDNRIGVTARRVRNLVIDGNLLTGNCSGVFVVGDESKPAAGAMTISGNRILENNKFCPATPRLSAIQGSGIVLTGSEATDVRSNVIRDNVGSTPLSGGILLFKSFVGALNTDNTISRNLVEGNKPADLADRDTSGTGNTFVSNTCGTSVPAGMCAG